MRNVRLADKVEWFQLYNSDGLFHEPAPREISQSRYFIMTVFVRKSFVANKYLHGIRDTEGYQGSNYPQYNTKSNYIVYTTILSVN